MRAQGVVFYALASPLVLFASHSGDLRSQSVDSSNAPAAPPVAPVRPVTEVYYCNKVVDPYRYMENLNDPEVQAWFKAQNDYTRAVLASIPGRSALLERIKQLDQSAPHPLAGARRQAQGPGRFEIERTHQTDRRDPTRTGTEGWGSLHHWLR